MGERIHSIQFIIENKGIANGTVNEDDNFNAIIKNIVKSGIKETKSLEEYTVNELTVNNYEQLNIKGRKGSGYRPNTQASDSFDCVIKWLGDADPGEQDTLTSYEVTISKASLVDISEYEVEDEHTRIYKNCSLRVPDKAQIWVVKDDTEDEDI